MSMMIQPKRSALALAVVAVVGVGAMVSTTSAEAALLSHVTDAVSGSGSSWNYEFTVFNDDIPSNGGDNTHLIIDWELPYFDDMGITNILSPNGWNWEIETIGVVNSATGWDGVAAWQDPNDPWYQLLDGANNPIFDATQVLHWYCGVDGGEGWGLSCFGGEGDGFFGGGPIFPGESLAGFGFDAAYGPTAAPYQTSWMNMPVNTGDPAFPSGVTVASPNAIGSVTVPEPGSIALMSLGLLGLVGAGYRRRKSLDDSQH